MTPAEAEPLVSVESLIAVLGAAGLGTILGHLLAAAKDRREVRSRALAAIQHVEELRWAPFDARELSAAMRDAGAALMLARVPRAVTRRYLLCAHAASIVSKDDYDQFPTPEGGGLPGNLDELVALAGRAALAVVWNPWIGRLRAYFLLARATRLEAAVPAGSSVANALTAAKRRAIT
ncbi:hypothetical protein [Promicromonospora sp. NPDC050249]|uniref:hypothetical protein n=1 Tax=Promicromonospora sp. NPDC050249 TaxID=3154743 RepID=UPI0033DB9269